jgi:hypothetical protein
MLGAQSEYDTGVNTFSPEGRIYQIEYAMNASKVSLIARRVGPWHRVRERRCLRRGKEIAVKIG